MAPQLLPWLARLTRTRTFGDHRDPPAIDDGFWHPRASESCMALDAIYGGGCITACTFSEHHDLSHALRSESPPHDPVPHELGGTAVLAQSFPEKLITVCCMFEFGLRTAQVTVPGYRRGRGGGGGAHHAATACVAHAARKRRVTCSVHTLGWYWRARSTILRVRTRTCVAPCAGFVSERA
eukprot:2474198-Rhodomonas_salina.4